MGSHGDDFEITADSIGEPGFGDVQRRQLMVPHLPRTPEEDAHFSRTATEN